MAASREFHRANKLALRTFTDTTHERAFRFELHIMRGDATNAQVWQKQKLRCMELESIYMVEPIGVGSSWCDVWPKLRWKRILGDLQVVKCSTGAGCLSLIDKQAGSIGMPSIANSLASDVLLPLANVDADGDEEPSVESVLPHIAVAEPIPETPADCSGRLDADDGPRVIHLFAICTDAGADESAARKSLHDRGARCPRVWFST